MHELIKEASQVGYTLRFLNSDHDMNTLTETYIKKLSKDIQEIIYDKSILTEKRINLYKYLLKNIIGYKQIIKQEKKIDKEEFRVLIFLISNLIEYKQRDNEEELLEIIISEIENIYE